MRDRNWILPTLILLAAQVAFCVCLAATFQFVQIPPWTKYLWTALPLTLFVFGVGLFQEARNRPYEPAKDRWMSVWIKYRSFLVAIGLFCAQFVIVTWAKTMLPLATTMWADVPLANADAAIFGRDPWLILPAPDAVIDMLYYSWVPVVASAFTVLYLFNRPNRNAGLLAFFLTSGLLETFGQYAFPSGGPLFFQRLGHGDRFAAMYEPLWTKDIAGALWEKFGNFHMAYGSGISAFPSMHVAISVWLAITFRNWFVTGYAIFIFIASIMLGWHYAVDGIAGAAGAVACYALAKVIVAKDWSWKPLARGASGVPA